MIAARVNCAGGTPPQRESAGAIEGALYFCALLAPGHDLPKATQIGLMDKRVNGGGSGGWAGGVND